MSERNETWTLDDVKDHVGQLFIVGFHGHVPTPQIRTLITNHRVGSIILFQRNIKNPIQLQKLTADLQLIAKEAAHTQPLFIGIDQENGHITRIKEPIAAQLPGPMTLAATHDVEDAYRVGHATTTMLESYGINFNYAPVGDVNSNPKNPVIGVRSPSDDPKIVGRVVSTQIRGYRDHGKVVSCVKHFPGHGDTAVDSHHGSPIIQKTKEQLEDCELIPFRRMIAEGIDTIMTAHVIVPGLAKNDFGAEHKLNQVPASLNPDAVATLREDLRYKGLIISDCLEMDAIRAKFGTVNGAMLALETGSDCAMICHTFDLQKEAIERAVKLVHSGQIDQEGVRQSVSRVRALKEKYSLSFERPRDATLSNQLFSEQKKLAVNIYAKSTTMVRHDPKAFPLSLNVGKVVLISFGKHKTDNGAVDSGGPDTEDYVSGSTYTSLIEDVSSSGGLEVIEIQLDSDRKLSTESEELIARVPAVILTTRNATLNSYQRDLGIRIGQQLGDKLIVVATCDPYDFLDDVDTIKNYMTIYEPTLPAFKAAVDVIFGLKPALGRLPLKQAHDDQNSHVRVLNVSDIPHVVRINELWQKVFPNWSIGLDRLQSLLRQKRCVCLLHPYGFAIAYLCDGMGKLTAIGVLPEHRNKGIGTSLIKRARKEVSKLGKVESWSVGSVFPRFWAGIPFDLDKGCGQFFIHRGFHKSTSPTARDLFRNITNNVAPPDIIDRVSKLHIDFVVWNPSLEEETMTKQRGNFGGNKAWVSAYEKLAANNQYDNVLVALDPTTKSQIGWTIMSEHRSIVADEFGFLPLCPSGDKTGLIACVGVDKDARGRGIGLGLMVRAMENMRERGVRGVLIDWVVIRGFYELLGYEPLWEYEAYEWPMGKTKTV